MKQLSLKPYAKMKDSGASWLGDVPEHWELLPNRALFVEVNERDHPGEQLLSVTIAKGVIPQRTLLSDMSKKDGSNADKSSYKLVEPGDIVYNKMRAWQGAVGVSAHRGIVSPAYVVQRHRQSAFPQYFHYLFRTPAFAKEAEQWSYGITSDMWSLRPEHFRLIHVCVPSVAEQQAIVRFLDHVDRLIGRYSRDKHKLTKLLEEQKQTIINRAVTRGRDPGVRLNPSGVEWLAAVPEHWRALRLKYAASVQTGLTLGKSYGDDVLIERPYVRVANVQAGWLDLSKVTMVRVPLAEAKRSTLAPGDVLMTEGGDADKLGRGCVWHGEVADCLHQNHIFAVRPNSKLLLSQYLTHVLASPYGRAYFQTTAKQTTNLAATNSTTLGELPLFLPDVGEQTAILSHLADECRPMDGAIERAQREVALVREYRRRLIADVLTGKLDVRRVGKQLADEISISEQPDAPNDAPEVDEAATNDFVAVGDDAEE